MNNTPEHSKSRHTVDVAVGAKIKRLCKKAGVSQSDLARILGLSFQQVQKYESGDNRVSASRLYEMAQILNATPGDFFCGYWANT
jgi:transcriptional regulator with XRE-family HTH domain